MDYECWKFGGDKRGDGMEGDPIPEMLEFLSLIDDGWLSSVHVAGRMEFHGRWPVLMVFCPRFAVPERYRK